MFYKNADGWICIESETVLLAVPVRAVPYLTTGDTTGLSAADVEFLAAYVDEMRHCYGRAYTGTFFKPVTPAEIEESKDMPDFMPEFLDTESEEMAPLFIRYEIDICG